MKKNCEICEICDKKLSLIFKLPRTENYYARYFYSCGDHLYFKSFGSIFPDEIGKLLWIDVKGVPLNEIPKVLI